MRETTVPKARLPTLEARSAPGARSLSTGSGAATAGARTGSS
jgi:hypothetical protein